eukprot:gene15250-20648_t
MNLVNGDIQDGVFQAENIRIAGLPKVARGPVTLGFRAEDANLVDSGGAIEAPAYSLELLGESSMVSMKIGPELVSIKASKDYSGEIGDVIRATVPARGLIMSGTTPTPQQFDARTTTLGLAVPAD